MGLSSLKILNRQQLSGPAFRFEKLTVQIQGRRGLANEKIPNRDFNDMDLRMSQHSSCEFQDALGLY